jgi:23S rRNA (pseudouridine1915-N3)-methyltransferase
MKVEIVAVGKVKQRGSAALVEEYMKRLGRYVKSGQVEVKECFYKGDVARGIREEGEALLSAAGEGVLVVLDERGEQLTSVELSRKLEGWMVNGERAVSFVIGGASGLSEQVKERATLVLSLSAMTLPHELARAILAEQLYRAMTIMRGEPYHKD